MKDWHGYDLRAIPLMDEDEAAQAIEDLKQWIEEVAPDGGEVFEPNNQAHQIITANDLASASMGRRKACLQDFEAWIHLCRTLTKNPKAFDDKIVFKNRFLAALSPILSALIQPVSPIENGFEWQDDGRHDINRYVSVENGPLTIAEIDNGQVDLTADDADADSGYKPR